jgi:hypothetical protein
MSLSPPADREPIHIRKVECRGWRRTDGFWDIEGHLTDTKTYGFDNFHRGRVEAGEPLHEMWLRVTIDDEFVIQSCEASTDNGPHAACGSVDANFAALKGEKMGPGIMRIVKERFGGVKGCTHIVELFGPVATTAFQTVGPILARNRPGGMRRVNRMDSCVALASDGEVIRREAPEAYTGK